MVLSALNATLHSILQQLNGDLHWHNGALLNVCLDHLAELAARTVLLLAQQVARTEVLEAIVADELCTLSALSCTRTTEDEEYSDFVAGPERRRAAAGGSSFDSRHIG